MIFHKLDELGRTEISLIPKTGLGCGYSSMFSLENNRFAAIGSVQNTCLFTSGWKGGFSGSPEGRDDGFIRQLFAKLIVIQNTLKERERSVETLPCIG